MLKFQSPDSNFHQEKNLHTAYTNKKINFVSVPTPPFMSIDGKTLEGEIKKVNFVKIICKRKFKIDLLIHGKYSKNIYYLSKGLGFVACYSQATPKENMEIFNVGYYHEYYEVSKRFLDHTLFLRLVYYYIPSSDGKGEEFIDPRFLEKGSDGELRTIKVKTKPLS